MVLIKRYALRSIIFQRFLSTVALPKKESVIEKPTLLRHNAKMTRLNNGTLVVSFENYSPITSINVLFKAGPRFETYANFGVNHALRTACSASTRNKSQFSLSRNLQQLGAEINCSNSREHITYSLQVPRNNLNKAFEYFTEISTMQDFKHWEVSNCIRDYLQLDLERIQGKHDIQAVEMLHKAAYRRALANSLYVEKIRIPIITNEIMTQYTCEMFTAAAMIVSGVGISHEHLIQLVTNMNVSGTATKPNPGIYYGGEERRDIPTAKLVHAILATRSFGICEKETPTTLVLQHLLGIGPHLKYSDNANTSRLKRAAQKAACNNIQVSCFNMTYSDSGLFGVQLLGHSSDIGPALKATSEQIGEITTGTISDELLLASKNSVKSSLMMELESCKNLAHDLAMQAANYGNLIDSKVTLEQIDQVDANMVRSVATQIIKGKACLAVVGNLSSVPYLDEVEL